MKFTAVLISALTCGAVFDCAAQTSSVLPEEFDSSVAASRVFDGGFGFQNFPLIIGPRTIVDRQTDDRGLGIGLQGSGTTIGQQGTTSIEPAMVPVFGPRDRFGIQNFGLIGGPAGFATAVSPQGQFGLIGPRGFNPRTGSQTIALAINAQASSITIGSVGGVGNHVNINPSGSTPPPMQMGRIVPIFQSPNNIFAGRAVTTPSVGVGGRGK